LGSVSAESLNITQIIYNITTIPQNGDGIIKLISVNLPESYIDTLEFMVTESKFPNRSEAIRVAIRDLIRNEFLMEQSIQSKIESPSSKEENLSELENALII